MSTLNYESIIMLNFSIKASVTFYHRKCLENMTFIVAPKEYKDVLDDPDLGPPHVF